MKKIAGATALAIGLSMSTMSVGQAAPAASSSEGSPSVATQSSAQAKKGNKCATRKEYRRVKVKGKRKNRATPRRVRRIMDFRGKRDRIDHSGGHKWETRKYRHCGSKIRHVYVNFKDNRAYFKTGRP